MSLEQPCISTVYGFCYSYPLLTEAIVQVHNEIFLFFGVILKIEDQAIQACDSFFFFLKCTLFSRLKIQTSERLMYLELKVIFFDLKTTSLWVNTINSDED